MLQPDSYLMAHHEAQFYVMVEVLSVHPPDRTPGTMRLECQVIQIYRTDGTLSVGDRVHFDEHVTRHGDEIPCGGIHWKAYHDVLGARYLEAFLNGEPPCCAVALSQSEVLPTPNKEPQMRGWYPLIAIRERRLRRLVVRRPWWRFWE